MLHYVVGRKATPDLSTVFSLFFKTVSLYRVKYSNISILFVHRISWRRENGKPIEFGNWQELKNVKVKMRKFKICFFFEKLYRKLLQSIQSYLERY